MFAVMNDCVPSIYYYILQLVEKLLDGCSVNSLSSVWNLGLLFDSNLCFDSHVSSICKTAFFHLKIYLN